ncbi:MAG: ATP-binding protein [Anaerolineae bacterium]
MTIEPQVLRAFGPFANLTDEEVAKIGPLCTPETYRAGATIFSEGEEAQALYLLQEGKVVLEKQIRLTTHGTPRRATVEIMRPGDAFGISTLVPPHYFKLSAFCLEDTEVIRIDGHGLRHLLEAEPHIGYEIALWVAGVSSDRLRDTTETLTYFLSVVSHELRSPLAAVESYLQVLMGGFTGPLTDKQHEMLRRSSVRIKELLGLISDLLDVSRLEPEHIQQEFEPTVLPSVIKAALDDVWLAAREKGIELKVKVPDDLPTITAAPGRVRQVLLNLLNNAVKYTPVRGRVTLRVEDIGDHLQISVTDTGIGIPAADQPFIFGDFYRARNAPAGGVGLGLSIAKRIVTAHGGRIWVESPYEEGQPGTRFTFTLPKNPEVKERKRSQPN